MLSAVSSRALSVAVMLLLGAPFLVACTKPAVDVSIHGVNYSDTAFSYYVVDPAKPNSTGAGELIDPFAAGGTVCCFSLPKRWRRGIKVQIHSTYWLQNRPDGSLPEVKRVQVADVPPYVEGKPGELWVIRSVDGSISVISSDFQPDHPKWPGKPKGWPVPSLEYRRERWELIKKHQEDFVRTHLSLLDELEKAPHTRANAAWEHAKKYGPSSLDGFSGPEDPRYIVALRKHYTEGLKESQEELKDVMESRP